MTHPGPGRIRSARAAGLQAVQHRGQLGDATAQAHLHGDTHELGIAPVVGQRRTVADGAAARRLRQWLRAGNRGAAATLRGWRAGAVRSAAAAAAAPARARRARAAPRHRHRSRAGAG
ncbi:hypothetical protein G6F22_007617 [Rhizopus arrhizus]|nr:hypothetical protein G6F22_007617 [Rhizopus arrhizus]